MSSTRHLRRRAARHQQHGQVGVLVGWCATEDDLPDARQGTHDALLIVMGDRRTGGVSWRQYTGDQANDVLDRFVVDEKRPELFDHYRRLRALLREYGGWIVVATAPGRQS